MFSVLFLVELDGMSGGFGFPFGCVAAVVAVLLADVAGATAHPWYALVTLGLVVVLAAYRTSAFASFGVAVVAWALHSGFVLGRLGQLAFSAAALVAALVLASALAFGLLTRLPRRSAPLAIPLPRRSAEMPAPRAMSPAG